MRIQTAAELGAAIRNRRLDSGLTQAALASKAGVSRKWLVEVEAGKYSAEVGRVLDVLWAVGLNIEITPEIGGSGG